MRRKSIISVAVAAIMALGMIGTPLVAKGDDGGSCDPANGKYICDGTEDQPEGAKDSLQLPKTGVS